MQLYSLREDPVNDGVVNNIFLQPLVLVHLGLFGHEAARLALWTASVLVLHRTGSVLVAAP